MTRKATRARARKFKPRAAANNRSVSVSKTIVVGELPLEIDVQVESDTSELAPGGRDPINDALLEATPTEPAEEPTPEASPEKEPAPGPFELVAGQRIGDLVIGDLLGEGATARVFEAEDTRLERPVAVKVLRTEAMTPEACARLEREARLCARVRSPHVPHVYDIGRLPDQRPYFAMERMRGPTLEQHLAARGPLAIPIAIKLALQLAQALDCVHRSGALHRDVKPQNLVLEKHDDEIVLKLVDFGISRYLLGPRVGRETARQKRVADRPSDPPPKPLTEVGIVLGTPAYMAPEQLRDEPLDLRVDVYATGAVLFEMLTGEPPFGCYAQAASRASCDSMDELSDRVLAGLRAGPSARRRDCPRALDRIVRKAMATDREDRYPCAASLADDLRALIAKTRPAFARPARAGRAESAQAEERVLAEELHDVTPTPTWSWRSLASAPGARIKGAIVFGAPALLAACVLAMGVSSPRGTLVAKAEEHPEVQVAASTPAVTSLAGGPAAGLKAKPEASGPVRRRIANAARSAHTDPPMTPNDPLVQLVATAQAFLVKWHEAEGHAARANGGGERAIPSNPY